MRASVKLALSVCVRQMRETRRFWSFSSTWLAMVILGWLAYALLRGLAAIIFLAVPFYDWQWYVPLILLLLVVPAYVLWSRSRHGKLRLTRGTAAFFTDSVDPNFAC